MDYQIDTELRGWIEQLIVQVARQDLGSGLLDGKVGVAIILFTCGRILQSRAMTILAEGILEETLNNLRKGSSLCFASGLSGIVWGIDFLIEHGYIDGDSSYICADLTKITMSVAPSRLDLSLEYGLKGLLHHVLAHMKRNTPSPFTKDFLQDIYNCALCMTKQSIDKGLQALSNAFICFYEGGNLEYTCSLQYLLDAVDESRTPPSPSDLSIQTGIGGRILKSIYLTHGGNCIGDKV